MAADRNSTYTTSFDFNCILQAKNARLLFACSCELARVYMRPSPTSRSRVHATFVSRVHATPRPVHKLHHVTRRYVSFPSTRLFPICLQVLSKDSESESKAQPATLTNGCKYWPSWWFVEVWMNSEKPLNFSCCDMWTIADPHSPHSCKHDVCNFCGKHQNVSDRVGRCLANWTQHKQAM